MITGVKWPTPGGNDKSKEMTREQEGDGQTGFGNEWTVTTEGTWLLRNSQSSVVS